MRIVFDHLPEHGLKLKPTKCDLFRTELIYLAHHVSKDGVKPSKKNVTSIIACSPPKTYTDWEVLYLFDSEVAVWVSGAAETVYYFG